jgi:tRNA (mo5U34)-methyltransferase
MSSTASTIAHQVAEYSGWFHRIDLGQNVVTPGIDDTPLKLKHVHLPPRLDGFSVIDIGAWDGFFSFECERRGATRVVAADWFCWQGTGKRGFEIAREALQSKVEDVNVKVEDMSPEALGTFDLVLFLGVLYHAQDPMRYLRVVRSLCKGTAIIETLVDALDYPRPAMVFYPGRTLNNDATNFWGPNRLAVEAMLREVGFSTVKMVDRYYGNRMVFHANV